MLIAGEKRRDTERRREKEIMRGGDRKRETERGRERGGKQKERERERERY